VTYRDVAEWLKRLPSVSLRADVKPKVLRFTEVRGFARDLAVPRFEPPRFVRARRDREVRVEWAEPSAPERPPTREPPKPKDASEPPARGAKAVVEEVAGGQRATQLAKRAEELARPIRAELPVAQLVKMRTAAAAPKAEELVGRAEERRVEAAPVEVPVKTSAGRAAAVETPRLEERVVARPVEAPTRELGPIYVPAWRREFVAPAIYPLEVRIFETPTLRELETATPKYGVWALETPAYGARTAETATYRQRTSDAFYVPPPAPFVRGGGYSWREPARPLYRSVRPMRRGWRVYELLRI